MRASWQRSCLWAAAFFVLAGLCQAQSVTPDQEYQKLIKVDQNIEPLGEHPFGENISTYDGSTSFNVTDVSLRGNGPTITVGRTAHFYEWPFNIDTTPPNFPFQDWDLDIPRIETIAATSLGWQTGLEGNSPTVGTTSRCTTFNPPPGIQSPLAEGGWTADEWWYGYNLMVPGQGSQQLMPRYSANTLSPTISGTSFNIVTKNNWMVTCGVTASDGGEGFLAIAPDGTRYTFAHLVYRPWYPIVGAGGVVPPDGSIVATETNGSAQSAVATKSLVTTKGVTPMTAGPGGLAILDREDALMYVTQIQDRFGNTLTYNYDPTSGYLTSITASDGREVDITYVSGSPDIQTITAKASNVASRTWTYSYGTGLTGVQLPDGSAWSYNLNVGAYNLLLPSNACSLNQFPYSNTTPVSGPGTITGTVTAPSGLTGTFGFVMKMSGRSYTPQLCWGQSGDTPPFEQAMAIWPEWYVQPAITSEVISGPGLTKQTWTYSYSPANASWTTDACATSGTCPTTVYTDVTDPNGNDTRYTFSNRFDATEGQQLRADTYSGAYGGTLMRSVINTYASATAGPWPSVYGIDLTYRDNYYQTEQLSPLSQRDTQEEGDDYRWIANAFNNYAQVTDASRYNSITGQTPIRETTAYLNDTNLWVLGLPQTVTNVGTGEVENNNVYNSMDLLQSRARFGQTLMSYTYNGAGQLASFTDGDNNTTSISNYYRGIPQSISYPDNTTESLTVTDLSNISSITDQAGYTTSYLYDQMGRVSQINYPSDTTSYWPTYITFVPVNTAEAGIAAGHWDRTVSTGSAKTVTYYDAEFRPVLSDTSIVGTSGSDISTAYAYDWAGKNTLTSYPIAGTVSLGGLFAGTYHSYDALERLTSTTENSELGNLTTTTSYLEGAGQQVTDPKGNVTTSYYQVFDEPSYSDVISVNAPTGVTQTIARDIYGNPLSITQSGAYGTETDSITKSLYYDSYHRLCATTEPESGSTLMGYDGANNLLWSADGQPSVSACTTPAAAVQTVRTYDAMNRVKTLTPPTGTQSTVYTYDARGNVATTISGISIQSFSYNARNGLTAEGLWLNNQSAWGLGFGYDAYNHIAAISYPLATGTGTAETVSYAPDALGRATQVGSYATGITYFPNGQVAGFTYGNGTTYSAQQNSRQLLSNFSYTNASTAQLNEGMTYDANANITNITDAVNGQRTKAFIYDGLDRLTNAMASNLYGTETYTYDALNNLRTRLSAGVTYSLNYNAANQLASVTNGATTVNTYGYDTSGNRNNTNGAALTFDAKNQMLQAAGYDTYSYDAEGRRVMKQAIGSTSPTYYFYDQSGQLMFQYLPTTASATNFIYLGTKLVARDASINSQITGSIDGVSIDGSGNATLVGWACSTNLAQSIDVDVYLGGQAGAGGVDIGRFLANVTSESAVATACGVTSGSYRFSIPLTAAQRTQYVGQLIYIYGISPVGNPNLSIAGSGKYTVPANPSAPAAPASVTATVAANLGSITAAWGSVTNATSYNVEYNVNGGAWSTAASVTTPTYTLTGPADGSYAFEVQACDTAGCSAGTASAAVGLWHVPPTAPSLSAPSVSTNGSYSVTWTGVSGQVSYNLQQQVNSGAWTAIQNSALTSWSASGEGDGTYAYRVQACNPGGCGPFSNTGTTTVLFPPASAPSLSGGGTSTTGSYSLSWTAVPNATYYSFWQNINGAGWTVPQSSSATSWSTSGEASGSYEYIVYACNASGCSSYSNPVTETVALIPAAPTVTVKQTSTGSFIIASVTWNAVPTATTYVVREIDGATITQMYSGPNTSWSGSYAYGPLRTFQVEACNSSGCSSWQ